jgi:hypothetical protein
MTPDEVRIIVREEITRALTTIRDKADGFYGEGDLQDAASVAVYKLLDQTLGTLAHEPACPFIVKRWAEWDDCTCGANAAIDEAERKERNRAV